MKSGCFPRMIFENISEMVKLPRSQTKPAASEATWDAFVLRPKKNSIVISRVDMFDSFDGLTTM